jgi:hypothetical protein
MEFLRNAHDLHAGGLELELRAYQCLLFVDPEEVVDGPARDWARLAARVGPAPLPDLRGALRDLLLGPVRAAVADLIRGELLRRIAGAALAASEEGVDAVLRAAIVEFRDGLGAIETAAGGSGRADEAAERTAGRLATLVGAVRASRNPHPGRGQRALARWLGTDRTRWGTLLGWSLAAGIGQVAGDAKDEASGVFDEWEVSRCLGEALGQLGLDDAARWRVVEAVRALVALPADALAGSRKDAQGLPESWFESMAVRSAVGAHEWEGADYIVQERWEELLDALAARDVVAGRSRSFEKTAGLRRAAAVAAFRLGSPPLGSPAAVPIGLAQPAADDPAKV